MKSPKPTHLWVGERYGLPFSSGMCAKRGPVCHRVRPDGMDQLWDVSFSPSKQWSDTQKTSESRSVFQVSGYNRVGLARLAFESTNQSDPFTDHGAHVRGHNQPLPAKTQTPSGRMMGHPQSCGRTSAPMMEMKLTKAKHVNLLSP